MSSQDTNSIEKDREGVEEVNRSILLKDSQRRQNASSINIPSVDTEISKMTADQKRNLVPELRELSRSIYLEKREKQQLELLETEIKDEEFVFDDSELTEHERRERENKRVYHMLFVVISSFLKWQRNVQNQKMIWMSTLCQHLNKFVYNPSFTCRQKMVM